MGISASNFRNIWRMSLFVLLLQWWSLNFKEVNTIPPTLKNPLHLGIIVWHNNTVLFLYHHIFIYMELSRFLKVVQTVCLSVLSLLKVLVAPPLWYSVKQTVIWKTCFYKWRCIISCVIFFVVLLCVSIMLREYFCITI